MEKKQAMHRVRDVPCPCCGKILYRTALIDADKDIWGLDKESPRIVSHEQGDFMKCPSCSKWVLMRRRSSPVGLGFELNDIQVCAEKLPD